MRLSTSIRLPRPAIRWSVPVSSIARVGLQAALAWKSVNRVPFFGILSMLGVRISPPKHVRSENPRSSATITRKFGLSEDAIVFYYGSRYASRRTKRSRGNDRSRCFSLGRGTATQPLLPIKWTSLRQPFASKTKCDDLLIR